MWASSSARLLTTSVAAAVNINDSVAREPKAGHFTLIVIRDSSSSLRRMKLSLYAAAAPPPPATGGHRQRSPRPFVYGSFLGALTNERG